jgi:hypothetical protein
MIKKVLKICAIGLFICLFISCNDCDDIGIVHGVRIEGQNLQEFFTVRLETGDTINHFREISSDTLWALTIGGRYEEELRDGVENFRFHIRAQDTLELNYNFAYRTGDCHVEKVGGPEKIMF